MQQFDLNTDLKIPNGDESLRNYALASYILFALGVFFGGLPALVGVILAYVKRQDAVGTIYHDHFRFLIRTFWGTLCGLILGYILLLVWIGIIVIFVVGIWYISRVVTGIIRFFERKSVTPTGWWL